MKRRKFIKNTIIGTVGATLLGGIYSWQIEPFWLEFVKKKMPIKNLPDHLIGKTLMQISDMHVGNRFDYQYIIDSFQKAQKLNPDFVVYTGDYVSYENKEQFTQLKKVLNHVVKGKLGTVGILGNHDYGKNWSEQEVANEITSLLEKDGVSILNNEQKNINGLNIIGLDDYWGLNFNPQKIMNQIDHKNANLVLCHNPDVCDLDAWNNYKGWILSGHTHGGQVKPPFLDPLILPVKNKKYAAGQIDLDDGRTLYINRALGCLWQVRFNVRPEITIFELEKQV
ncbi:UDP-2,3-diacylglucosamine pyrophosphatase LpxG [Polaribacter huanghezhanensis]|uniref:metallophosphoesterase n=1 Tax=Polaribacter huanghezhanensis TaxID=1354726 RepID=UPI0026482798|nr:metallophosphoesterase [Polaribacter huanghezhanensis]WKD86481.1 UDP-2,3-diacylglucosamine pyrophosphatase LpxG [Polaribacter huanghezhanensis]